MKLAVSQIAWQPEEEEAALELLRSCGFTGLEIAPPRLVGPQPYGAPQKAAAYARQLKAGWGLDICSMQSIWYGVSGSMFGPERAMLLDYTKKAVGFAAAAGCPNLVFGCPKNRVLPQGVSPDDALPFFAELAACAAACGASVNLEPNPPLYGTNFINTTAEALSMVREISSPGFGLNLDFGTIVENGEDVAALAGQVCLIRHVHISEPNLVPIVRREGHRQLAALLRDEGYAGYVSIEMKAVPPDALRAAAEYVAEVFA